MKAEFNRQSLLAASQTAASLVTGATIVKPILANVKIEAYGDSAAVSAMSPTMESGVRVAIRGLTILEEGEGLVPAAKLVAVLREMGDETVRVEIAMDGAVLKGASCCFDMLSDDPANFPAIDEFDESRPHHRISSADFDTLVSRTAFAVSSSGHSRLGAIGGVLLKAIGDRVVFVGTDGRQLAVAEAAAESIHGHSTDKYDRVVPVPALSLIQQCARDGTETVKITIKPDCLIASTDRATVVSKLIEGRFPPYERVIPKDFVGTMRLDARAFIQATRQAALMADVESCRVHYGVDFKAKKIRLRASSSSAGRSSVEMLVDGQCDGGSAVEVALQPAFIRGAMKDVIGDEVELCVTKDGPVVIRSPGFTYVVQRITEAPV